MTPTIAAEQLPSALADDLPSAFPDLVRSLQDDVYSGALRLTGSPADAEDLTQETFVRAYRALRDYPADRIRDLRLRGWVWTIALNLCRNRARTLARRREEPLADLHEVTEPGPGPESEALADDRRRRLAVKLAGLPWVMRASVVLRHVVDLPYAEISRILDRPEATVRSDVHRGLGRLRAGLEEAP